MAIIPKFFIDAVVALGEKNNGSQTNWIGTGFLLNRKVDNNDHVRPYLITNKHVVEDKKELIVRLKEKGLDNLKDCELNLQDENGNPLYKFHSNSKIDIAAIPLNGKYFEDNNLDFSSFDIDVNAMTTSELRDNGVDEGELIYMIGFPLGLVNVKSGVPISRLGCIGRMSENQINEEHNILVDIQNFPGNSGSPIVLRPENISIKGTKSLNRSVLIGIVHSYIPYRESLVSTQTGKVVEVRTENSGIANVHPVEYIREIIDMIQPKI